MKKGFTLIELLAVIVILAVIALIATPIIINIINDARSQAEVTSVNSYVKAVELAIARKNMTSIVPDGIYQVTSDGSLVNGDIVIPVDMDNNIVQGGIIVISDGVISNVIDLYTGNDTFALNASGQVIRASEVDDSNVEYTDDSCFTTTTQRVKTYTVTSSCPAVAQAISSTFGLDWDLEDAEAFCSGESYGAFQIDEVLNQPAFAQAFIEYGAVTVSEYETINGIAITGYTCSQDESVTIPKTINNKAVTEIRQSAFNSSILGFTIYNVELPNTINRIDSLAFWGNELTTIIIPSSVTYLGTEAFESNQLTAVYIGNGIREINPYTFYDNYISELYIGNNVQIIGKAAFGDNNLTSVTLPNNVQIIGYDAFCNNNLTSVTLPNNLQKIGDLAFENNDLRNITIPSNVYEIGIYAFLGNDNLTSAVFENITGWTATLYDDHDHEILDGPYTISSSDLSTPAAAAATLLNYYWTTWERATN